MDPFDPENLRWDAYERKRKLRRRGGMSLFRSIWEACTARERDELKQLLHAQHLLESRLWAVTKFRLCAPNIALSNHDGAPCEALTDDLDKVLSIAGEHFITPVEYLCAIACWEADEPYQEAKPICTHPRWPYKHTWIQEFESTDSAPQSPG